MYIYTYICAYKHVRISQSFSSSKYHSQPSNVYVRTDLYYTYVNIQKNTYMFIYVHMHIYICAYNH
jgi:hypothetical protein